MMTFIAVVVGIVRRPSSSAATCPLAMNRRTVITGAMARSMIIAAFASSFMDPSDCRQLIVD